MIESLACIKCGGDVSPDFACVGCGKRYPVMDGVPVFLGNSVFSASDLNPQKSGFSSGVTARIGRLLPSITWLSPEAKSVVGRAARSLAGRTDRCLVVGCGEAEVAEDLTIFKEVIFSDVVASPGACIICDGHELPFKNDSLDAVVLTAVLEHVVDPERVVSEITRALRPGGLVIAATPFISQVHMGAHDFQRFTDLGHRWLFRSFVEVERGVTSAAGTALLWSLEYFARAFFSSRTAANAAAAIVRLTFFWLKHFDALLHRKPGAYDSGAGYYFVGTNAKTPCITPLELLAQYRGMKR